MESLGPKKGESIKKLSDARLVANLTKAGVSLDDIEAMDRAAMLDRWARLIQSGGEKGHVAVTSAMMGYDVTLEKEQLVFQLRKWETQQEAD
jgi:hypothetical protein